MRALWDWLRDAGQMEPWMRRDDRDAIVWEMRAGFAALRRDFAKMSDATLAGLQHLSDDLDAISAAETDISVALDTVVSELAAATAAGATIPQNVQDAVAAAVAKADALSSAVASVQAKADAAAAPAGTTTTTTTPAPAPTSGT